MARLFSVQVENDEFHKKLGGGLPRGTLGVLIGENGSGKSVVCQRITYGLLKNGVSVSYVSTQLTTVDFIKQMSSLGYGVESHVISGKLSFFPVYPLISELKERQDYLNKLISGRSIFEKDVIVIDSFSSLVKFDLSPRSAIDIVGFLKRITATGKAVILTILSGEIEKDTLLEIESTATFVGECSLRKFGADVKNMMTIKKYNFALQQYQKQIAFRVEPKIGLVVEIAAVA
jgi:flagellar protein FlaH